MRRRQPLNCLYHVRVDTGGGVGHVCFLCGAEEDQVFLDQTALSLGVRKPVPLRISAHQQVTAHYKPPCSGLRAASDPSMLRKHDYYHESPIADSMHLCTCS